MSNSCDPLSFSSDRPMIFRFSDVVRQYPPPDLRIIEIVREIWRDLELVFRESDPMDFDASQQRQLQQLFGKGTHPSVYSVNDCLLVEEDWILVNNDWLLKIGITDRVGRFFAGVAEGVAGSYYHCFNNIFRVPMCRWLVEVNRREGYEMVVPEEHLIPLPPQESSIPDFASYAILSKKMAFFEGDHVVRILKEMPLGTQRKMIDYLASWVMKSGYQDCHFENIGLSKTERMDLFGVEVPKFVVIDTEPYGLMTEEEDDPPDSLLAEGVFRKRLTLAEAAYIGLMKLQRGLREKEFDPSVQQIVTRWVDVAKGGISLEKPAAPPRQRKWLRFSRT